ncbi:glucosaminidase domain-containing protein [Cohnella nanjingensis]|uniref:Glucosaminidase domain-containing protein n=1 Tax=Cohnella nanjingensis TaxID=1387779 RepID=A0A7X0VD12_9BACL|nr:glucosaminidase domain-containing protein [Cohnella nanjingensis]MBB6669206.1 glucosaminidase domain-containing protein [Cohnella nanjingensis]
MERIALLSPQDVSVIRRYVQTKYAPLADGRQAEIVADAIRRTIERRLPDWPDALRRAVTDKLIHRCVVAEQREVLPEDVLDACGETGGADSVDAGTLLRWLNERTSNPWSAERLSAHLRSRATEPAMGANGPEGAATAVAAGSVPAADSGAGESGEWRSRRLIAWGRRLAWPLLAVSLAVGLTVAVSRQPARETEPRAVPQPTAVATPVPKPDAGMPEALRYADIDATAVKRYLRTRDSMLADEPYFGAIVKSARKHDVNPLLLFAIVGQEQGFVPKSNKQAKQIANNPFNVFHSWETYNTDILDASDIAAKLLAKLGRSRPEGRDPFAWFNRTYAEDPAWAVGVRKLFDKLSSLPAS